MQPEFAVHGDRSDVTRRLLFLCIGAAALMLIASLFLLATEDAPWLLGLQGAALMLTDVFAFAAAASFATWLYRAYANLQHLAVTTTYTPRAAVAWFFLPVANLIVPHTILRELWRGSIPPASRSVQKVPRRPVDVVSLWWFLFIAYTVAANAAAAYLFNQATAHLPRVHVLLIVSAVLGVLAAALGADTIRLIDTRQLLRRKAIAEGRTAIAIPVKKKETKPGWQEVLLPVVTAIESELDRSDVVPPVREMPRPAPVPRARFELPQVRFSPHFITAALLVIAGTYSLVLVAAWLELTHYIPRWSLFFLFWIAAGVALLRSSAHIVVLTRRARLLFRVFLVGMPIGFLLPFVIGPLALVLLFAIVIAGAAGAFLTAATIVRATTASAAAPEPTPDLQ